MFSNVKSEIKGNFKKIVFKEKITIKWVYLLLLDLFKYFFR